MSIQKYGGRGHAPKPIGGVRGTRRHRHKISITIDNLQLISISRMEIRQLKQILIARI